MPRRGTRVQNVRAYTYEIRGLKDFQEALRLVGDQYPDQIKDANTWIAQEVVKRARRRGQTWGGSVAKGTRSMRASVSAKNAAILGGSTGSKTDREVFYGAEFGILRMTQGRKLPGGGRGPRKRKGGFQRWRGNQFQGWEGGPGYFLFPTIREDADDLIREYERRLVDLEREAFPE